MHLALQRRVITLLLKYLYNGESLPVEYNSALISQLLVHAQKASGNVSINLPRGYRFIREYAKLTFARKQIGGNGVAESITEAGSGRYR